METIVARATDGESARRKTIAVGYLRMTRQQMDEAARNRATYARLGNAYGLTHHTIGEILGITEQQVRRIVYGD